VTQQKINSVNAAGYIISSNHNKRWKPKERVSWRLLVLFLPFQDTGRTINKSACGCKVKG